MYNDCRDRSWQSRCRRWIQQCVHRWTSSSRPSMVCPFSSALLLFFPIITCSVNFNKLNANTWIACTPSLSLSFLSLPKCTRWDICAMIVPVSKGVYDIKVKLQQTVDAYATSKNRDTLFKDFLETLPKVQSRKNKGQGPCSVLILECSIFFLLLLFVLHGSRVMVCLLTSSIEFLFFLFVLFFFL